MGKSLGETLFKLLGILAIIEAVKMLGEVLAYGMSDVGKDAPFNVSLLHLAVYVPFLLLLGGGCFLILRSRQLASAGRESEVSSSSAVPTAHSHAILVSLTGLFLIGTALGELPYPVSELMIVYSEPDNLRGTLDPPGMAWGILIGAVLQLGIGVVLVLRSTALVSLFRRRWDRARPEAADAQCPHCGFWIVASDYREGAPGYRCDNCKGEIPRDLLRPG
jgi:hypothetical protein